MPDRAHNRRSIRLSGYDYSQAGAYFVTICSFGRRCVFGEVAGPEVLPSSWGAIVEEEWLHSLEIRREIDLDVFVVMPNHFHGIVVIMASDAAGTVGQSPLPASSCHGSTGASRRSPLRPERPRGTGTRSLGAFIAGFKSTVARRIQLMGGAKREPVWQRGYFERIIRDERELTRIREYIATNPANWANDSENPAAMSWRSR